MSDLLSLLGVTLSTLVLEKEQFIGLHGKKILSEKYSVCIMIILAIVQSKHFSLKVSVYVFFPV